MVGKSSLYRLYFTLNTFEGLLALFTIFKEPSMQGYAGLFGYSAWRLALGAWRTPAVHDYQVYAPIFVDTLVIYEAFWAAFTRALPLVAWSLAILVQTLLFVLVNFARLYRQAGFFS